MDRRRFVPSAEGMEGRALMSLFGGSAASSNATQTLHDLPETFQQKEQRIERLPFYLKQEDPERFLPPETIRHLQEDLSAIAGRLHGPSAPVIEAFNRGLRDAFPHKSLSVDDARRLNHAFGRVLDAAGATPSQTANLQRDMNELARVDSQSREPTMLASNDYALVLQTALAVGRPIQTPNAPTLLSRDGVRVQGGAAGLTHNHTPTLVGTYEVGATSDASTRMQILDAGGNVLGTGAVESNGRYTATITQPLPDGTYALRARAVDAVGHLSLPSHVFTLKVVTPPPGGPLGLR